MTTGLGARIKLLRADAQWKEERERVFLRDYLSELGKTEESDVYISIKEIMERWGYGRFYEEMCDILLSKVQNNPDESLCVYYDTGGFEEDKSRQKLLGWDIYHEIDQRFVLVGGVLFQDDKMSFHT